MHSRKKSHSYWTKFSQPCNTKLFENPKYRTQAYHVACSRHSESGEQEKTRRLSLCFYYWVISSQLVIRFIGVPNLNCLSLNITFWKARKFGIRLLVSLITHPFPFLFFICFCFVFLTYATSQWKLICHVNLMCVDFISLCSLCVIINYM